MRGIFSKWLPAISVFILLTGCKQETKESWDGELAGRWELNWAQVNSAETDRLRDLYFVFLPEMRMLSNILGSEKNFQYEVEGEIITQLGDPQLHYQVMEASDITLTMKTEIRGSVFTIYLDKAKPKINTQH